MSNSSSDQHENHAASTTVGIGGLLGVAFVVLRLCGVINWSWWWVLAPFWIPVAFSLLIVIFALVLSGKYGPEKGGW